MKSAVTTLRQLMRDRSAALGFCLVALVVLAAILAPWLSPHPEAVWDMEDQQLVEAIKQHISDLAQRDQSVAIAGRAEANGR